ncbi:hypothetical protein [Roseinatronobacter sp.]|uniref:hypothetical protein n=1 Tax=Roseinatronobacter sp. TaxID=1945755 RepID=UPI0025E6F310|nr:hypothetical protein [Roseibaca sp.]
MSDIYAARFEIMRDDCWRLAKQAADELADLIAHCLLLAHARNLDVDAALSRKWLARLPPQLTSED